MSRSSEALVACFPAGFRRFSFWPWPSVIQSSRSRVGGADSRIDDSIHAGEASSSVSAALAFDDVIEPAYGELLAPNLVHSRVLRAPELRGRPRTRARGARRAVSASFPVFRLDRSTFLLGVLLQCVLCFCTGRRRSVCLLLLSAWQSVRRMCRRAQQTSACACQSPGASPSSSYSSSRSSEHPPMKRSICAPFPVS